MISRPLTYVLAHRQPVPEPNPRLWVLWMSNLDNRTVGKTTVDEMEVSTVFLGMDHNFTGDGDPILFETMIFHIGDKGDDSYMERCCTWEEAEAMHERAVNQAKSWLAKASSVTIKFWVSWS